MANSYKEYASKEWVEDLLGDSSTHTHTSDDLVLTDTATGTKYRLYATNGKLTMVTDGEEVPTVFENGEEMTF